MKSVKAKTKFKLSFKHQTHKGVIVRFGFILLIFIAYFLFISSKYGYADGMLIAWLSWSFFVLCTPIADAGMMIDFPVRLVSGIRMFISEIVVWIAAIALNFYAVAFQSEAYEQTQLLHLFKHIIDNPVPFWSIFLISGVGTFLSIQLGDDLLDVIRHRDNKKAGLNDLKIKIIYMVFVLIITFALYDFLLTKFNFDIPL